MSAIVAFLGTKLGLAVAGVGSGLVATLLIKVGRPKLQQLFAGLLLKGLAPNVNDPKEKEYLKNLAVDFIKYAEYKIPDRGTGAAKKDLAIELLSAYMPSSSVDAIGRIVQEVFDTLDDELKKKL